MYWYQCGASYVYIWTIDMNERKLQCPKTWVNPLLGLEWADTFDTFQNLLNIFLHWSHSEHVSWDNTNHINAHSLLSHSTTFGGVSSPKALCIPRKITRRIYWTIQPCLWGQSWFILGTRWIFMRLETIWYSLIMRPPPMMTSCRTFLHKFRPNELKPTQT